ncbi:hypothetical protein [Krasilnikoviella flava]|uniref:Uncharacterized protein n=1 Tax=Krasilnikoviella flava TaxID=526729 RepID=A0A1T5JZG3_9MICO|nr:hypothetical protein [Krasilnikoviella flava]SKC56744.1 hypothetical protein SAMN04324258_1692 [Krasilnikoviella flava]
MTDSPDRPGGDAVELGAADSLRLIREQQDRARAALEPDGRALYGAWGVAWLAGYLVLWTSARAHGAPEAWAYWVFAGALAAAVVFTMVHTISRTSGTRGVSARTGAMYGWSWMLGFLTFSVFLGGLARAGADGELMALVSNGGACLVVGLLYLGGAAAFGDRSLFVLGAWILLVAAAATIAGLPMTYLVMALAGGGGFLVMAAVEHLRLLRGRRRADGAVGRG